MVLNFNLTLSNDTIALYVSISARAYTLTNQNASGCGYRLLTQQPSRKRVSVLFTQQPTLFTS
jgi:hypothetical protein